MRIQKGKEEKEEKEVATESVINCVDGLSGFFSMEQSLRYLEQYMTVMGCNLCLRRAADIYLFFCLAIQNTKCSCSMDLFLFLFFI